MGASRPGTINAAFFISIALPVLYTVLVVVNLFLTHGFMTGAMEDQLAAEGLSAGSDEAKAAAGVATGIFVMVSAIMGFIYLVLTGLWILFGFKLRAGRNWARITLTTLGAIWALYAAIALITGASGTGATQLPAGVEMPVGIQVVSYGMNGLALVGVIAFIVMAFMKPSNWYIQGAQYR